jgi:DNA-binding NarL/FixJ family response regulator
MDGSVPVVIVYRSRLLRDGLCGLLAQRADVRVVAAVGSVTEALEHPVGEDHVMVCDHATVEKEARMVRSLPQTRPQARILVINVPEDEDAIVDCVGVGASGCILADASLEEVVEAIRCVWHGTPAMSARCITSLFRYVARLRGGGSLPPTVNLTRRERQILELIVEGLTNKEIAQRLYLQPQTVKNYVHQVLQKLDVHSRLEAVRRMRVSAS